MKASELEIGGRYRCRIGDEVATVTLVRASQKGWIVQRDGDGKPLEHVHLSEQFRETEDDYKERMSRKHEIDPNRCSTSRCRNEPAITYLGRPLCQACWQAQAADDEEPEMANAVTENGKKKMHHNDNNPKVHQTNKPKVSKKKRMSALDAAAQVLRESDKAMNCPDLIEAMSSQGLWTSPGGKTPHSTLYAAIGREITEKGKESRFRKVDRGTFAYAGD